MKANLEQMFGQKWVSSVVNTVKDYGKGWIRLRLAFLSNYWGSLLTSIDIIAAPRQTR